MDHWKVNVHSADETQALAEALGSLLFENAVLRLEGELGAGKTTFTQGLARGLGIDRYIKSPSYTLIREYPADPLSLYHMDFYRLEDVGLDGLSLEDYWDRQGVLVIEWASMVDEGDLPQDYLLIEIESSLDELEERYLTFSAHGERYQQLLKEFTSQRL